MAEGFSAVATAVNNQGHSKCKNTVYQNRHERRAEPHLESRGGRAGEPGSARRRQAGLPGGGRHEPCPRPPLLLGELPGPPLRLSSVPGRRLDAGVAGLQRRVGNLDSGSRDAGSQN